MSVSQHRAIALLLDEVVQDFQGVHTPAAVPPAAISTERKRRVAKVEEGPDLSNMTDTDRLLMSKSEIERLLQRIGELESGSLVFKDHLEALSNKNKAMMKLYKHQVRRAELAEKRLLVCETNWKKEAEKVAETSSADDTKQREGMLKQLSCPICYDVLYEPISLPHCSHNFCRICWVQCALHCAERGEVSRCPQCRTVEEGVDFPTDTTIWGVVQMLFPLEVYTRKKNWFEYMSTRNRLDMVASE
jgi:hypothetical protein